jgi:poly(A) polymerase
VLYRLNSAGYQSYLVGGGVRDLLLGHEPKDFDVVTDATPEQVRKLFRNSRLIGRRFRLAHVFFGRDIVEVATFRGSGEGVGGESELTQSDEGRLLRDNVYGTIEEDAWRRDFSVNALFYNIADFSVLDYVGGMDDINAGILRLIGDPETRFHEDPVRMLRAVRFAVKLGFLIEPRTEEPIWKHAALLNDISPSRLFDESIKLFFSGQALQTFEMLRHYGIFGVLYPQTEESLALEEQGFPLMLVAKAMESTDARIAVGKPVTPAFLYAAILWEPVRQMAESLSAREEVSFTHAIQQAGGKVLSIQSKHTSIPKRFSFPMRDIWALQPRFAQRTGGRPFKLMEHPRFRAAYDFMVLRAESGEAPQELADWWTRFQTLDRDEQNALTHGKGRDGGRSRPRKRRRRKPRAAVNNPDSSGN